MRKIIVILLLLPLCLKAQIDIRQDNIRTAPVCKPIVYDSLEPFTVKPFNSFSGNEQEKLDAYKNHLKQYVGQDIYFIPDYSKHDSLIKLEISNYTLIDATHLDLDTKFYHPNKYEKFIFGEETKYHVEYKRDILGRIKKSVSTTEHDIIDSTNVYKAISVKHPTYGHQFFYTPYSAYLGHYFKIIDFLVEQKSNTEFSLVMLDNNNDTIVYYPKQTSIDWFGPKFILVGYYTKMKELHVGNDYIFSPSNNRDINTNDINTGAQIIIKVGSEWHCSSLEFINIDGGLLQPYFILNNKEGNSIKVRLDDSKKESSPLLLDKFINKLDKFINKQDYIKQKELEKLQYAERERLLAEEKARKEKERLEFEKMIINKYGEYYGNLIIKKQVVIGMSDEMCRYAWGKPLRINTTIVEGLKSEQWVYSLYSYLYFDNGILTAIQN